jgi:hypothetical protein
MSSGQKARSNWQTQLAIGKKQLAKGKTTQKLNPNNKQ